MGRSRRTLPEELLLLALDPATGTTAQPQSLDLGLCRDVLDLAEKFRGRLDPDCLFIGHGFYPPVADTDSIG